MPYLDSLRGKEVVISGAYHEFGLTKPELQRRARRAGARHVGYEPRTTTDVFVRGVNPLYKYGDYGDKEVELAGKAPSAVVITGKQFLDVLAGKRVRGLSATAIAPSPAATPPKPPKQTGGVLGKPFVPVSTNVATTKAKPFTRDPDVVDRGLRGHRLTLNALAAAVKAVGFKPLEADGSACAFDLAWHGPGGVWVAEVKSLAADNERLQLRLGLGQVLDYAHSLRAAGYEVAGVVLAVEAEPSETRWVDLCAAAAVTLVWPGSMPTLFERAVPRKFA